MRLEEFLEALRLYFGLPVVEAVNVADSYDELMREVRDALMRWPGRPAQEMSVYYTFSDRVVAYQWVEAGPNRVWEIPWSRNQTGEIIFGTAVEVKRVITYVPMSEAQGGKEERFTEQVEQMLVTVESTAADGPRRVKAVGITADVVNGNRRRYPRAVLGAALADLNSHLHESAGQGRMILTGEAEHPGQKGGRTNILETVVKWEAAALNAAGQVILEGVILPTAKGKDVQVLIENGVPIGVSQRAYGVSKSVREGDGVVEELVQLRITGYDLVSEPSDPNGRITESREKPEEKRAMNLEELLKLLDEKPEMAEALMKRMGFADKKALAESMGIDPAKLEEGMKAAKAAQDELAERKRQEAIGQAITEATKDLKYGEKVNGLFVEAVRAAKPGKAEDVKSIVESKRAEYDGMMAAAKLGSMGHRPQGGVIERVGTGFEEATGLPEYAKPAYMLTEALVQRQWGKGGFDWMKPTSANEIFAKRYLEAYDRAYKSQLMDEARRYQLMQEAEAVSDLNLPYSVQRAIIAEAVPELVALSVFDFGLADTSPTRIYYEAYSGESGSSATITDETFTADHDTWVSLAHKRVRSGLVVELGGTSTVKAEYTDYVVDYASGRVMILSTGTISDSADLDITYTYDSVREGEGQAIQRGKGTLSYQTIELVADRLAAEINDEAVVFATTQLGWDAQTRTVGMLIREVREMIDSGIMRLGIAQAHIAANSGGTWTSSTDPLSELVEKIGVAKVAVQNDYYMPTAALMSVTNADRLSNWDGYTAAGARSTARQDGGMLGAGDTGLSVKGLPVFASTQMPDAKILVLNRELVQHRVLGIKPMHLEGPFPSYSSNKLIAAKQWYIEEYNQTVSLIAAKGAYVTVA